MGIPGLIQAIGKGERISLSRLAVTHLEQTSRPIRIAVDISIWLFQAQAGRGGRNPELRTLFFRLLKFLALPVHPLFVYDGKNKPPFKRGREVSGRSYGSAPIIRHSKALIRLFKFPIHDAPGEAEAECAKLQQAGVVDAVMSNDVDALMFGSTSTMKDFSKEQGITTSATHVTLYEMSDQNKKSKAHLNRDGMILFAMLSGGDYLPAGVPKCGSKLAEEIAKAGFGGDLLNEVYKSTNVDVALQEWRDRLQCELEENLSGYFKTKHKAVRIPETFPDLTVLNFYANPVVSNTEDIEALRDNLVNAWDKDIDIQELRAFAAEYFEWNYRSGARKVVRLLAEPLVSRRLRLGKPPSAFPWNPSLLSQNEVPMLQKVYKSREQFSTDSLSELQLDFVPIDVVGLDILAEEPNPPTLSQGSTGSGDEEEEDLEVTTETAQPTIKARVKPRYDIYGTEKIWIFETVATLGLPDVVRQWKEEQAAKASAPKKATKPTQRKTGPKKKGPLDPNMQRGSILKYGTLTKRPEMPESKHAQLFEAAVSASPTKTSPSKAGRQTSPWSRDVGVREVFNIDGVEGYPAFDDLAHIFSSSCTISPGLGAKRPPVRPRMTRRAATSSDGIEIDDFEDQSAEYILEPFPQSSPPRIRMSYSNSSYSPVDNQSPVRKDMNISPAKPRRRQQKTSRPSPDFEDSIEVERLQDAMFTLSLTKHDSYCEAGTPFPAASPRPKSKKKLDEPPVDSPKKQTKEKPAKKQEKPKKLDESSLDTPKKQTKEKPALDRSKSEPATISSKPTKAKTGKPQEGTSQHVERITTYDGFWTVEPETETELDSAETHDEEDQGHKDDKNDKKKKKRLPRVSILDLQ